MTAALRTGFVLALVFVVAACAAGRTAPAVPKASVELAEIPGFPDVRQWGDRAPQDLANRLATFRAQRAAAPATPPAIDALIISGGGADGAFAAGLLTAWSDLGTRPDFTFVTGISAGSLVAPLAFLGPAEDPEMERFSTANETSTLIELAPVSGLIGGYGLSTSDGLRGQIAAWLTDKRMGLIAAEHAKGRRLWIGTTNLDAQRPVIWDIGAIATIGGPRAQALIVDVILASASPPVAFRPVFVDVEVAGTAHTEMHVDGGVTQQLFFYPAAARLPELPVRLGEAVERGTLYVIRNGKIGPEWQEVPGSLASIAERSILTMTKYGGRQDIRTVEVQARRAGFGLSLASMPDTFEVVAEEAFDRAYMTALYQEARDMMLEGRAWTRRLAPRAEGRGLAQ